MKRLSRLLVLCVVALALTAAPASAISLSLSALPAGGIQFNGTASSFDLMPGAGPFAPWQMWITNVTGGAGTSLGYSAAVWGGPWSYGPITVSGDDQWAAVLGPLGTLNIFDGAFFLTATVNWIEVSSHDSIGAVNGHLVLNMANIAYAGGDPDLIALAAVPTGYMNLSFQFTNGKNLTKLTQDNGPNKTSYSASISNNPVPEGGVTLVLLGIGLAGLGVLRRRIG